MKAYVIGIASDRVHQNKAVKKLNYLGFDGVALAGVNGRQDGIDAKDHVSLASRFQSSYMKNRATHWQLPVHDLRGALGCSLSHLKVWKDMVANDISFAIVGESDMLPHHNLSDRVNAALAYKDDWDLVLLGYTTTNYYLKDTHLENTYKKFKKGKSGFFGTHGYLVSKKGAQTMIDHFYPVEYQTDAYLTMLIYLDKLRTWYDTTKPVHVRKIVGKKSSTQVGNSGRLSFCHGAPFAVSPGYIAMYVLFIVLLVLSFTFIVLYSQERKKN